MTPSGLGKPRILVVEDDDTIRSALMVALEGEGYEARGEADGSTISSVGEVFSPDLAILDVRLPTGPDGYSIARILRGSSDLPIVFLTAADGLDARLAGFRAGADDYLVKPFSMAELLARINALLRRSGRLSTRTLRVADLVIDHASRTVVRSEAILDLTRLEYELLSVLVRHQGEVLSKVQLLTLVWGFDAFNTNLVDVHLSSLRRKLEGHGPRLIHTVRGVGYVVRP